MLLWKIELKKPKTDTIPMSGVICPTICCSTENEDLPGDKETGQFLLLFLKYPRVIVLSIYEDTVTLRGQTP